jgi:hypothetical protein
MHRHYPEEQFKKFTATELFCKHCERAMPVKETLLLVLADGDLYGYRCVRCGDFVGTRKETKANNEKII